MWGLAPGDPAKEWQEMKDTADEKSGTAQWDFEIR